MDGVLIESEPMWRDAEKQVFSSVGVKLTDQLSAHTAAMAIGEISKFPCMFFAVLMATWQEY